MELVTTSPRVELIARTVIDWEGLKRVLAERGHIWEHEDVPHSSLSVASDGTPVCAVQGSDAELLAEFAGRICYNAFDGPGGAGMGRKTNREYIEHILKVGHGSVLEHADFTFMVWGDSRGFTHETVRHRVGTAYSQSSTRFRDEGKFGRLIPPPLFHGDPEALEVLAEVAEQADRQYSRLRACARRILKDVDIDRTAKIKTARGAARAVLPIGLESPILVTMNVRQTRNYLDQRASPFAELEIREIAMLIYRIMLKECPNIFADYEVIGVADGTEALTSLYRKV